MNISPVSLKINTTQNNNVPQNTQQKRVNNPNILNFSAKRERKISFKEGSSIFVSGIIKQGIDTVKSIVEHPIKTIAIVGGTTIGLMALPFIGIPTAVGGAALAIGFASFAIAKGAYHTIQFANNNKNGNYNLARKNLQNMGEDTIDIALSAPFIPKSVSRIQNFAQYGKLGFNQQLINTLRNEKSIIKKFKALKNFDKNMSRSINYQSSVDKELAKYKDFTDSEKAALKKDILDYNVPKQDIPIVVLQKWAEKNGITTLPEIKFATIPQNVGGYAIIKDCSIVLNDYKRKITPNNFSNYRQLSARLLNNEYEITYRDLKTGNIIKETISKDLLDSYNRLYELEKQLTPEARNILVTLHEREHINQYTQIFGQNGFTWSPTTTEGQARYTQMMNELNRNPKIKFSQQELETLSDKSAITTPLSYIKNPREIGARNVEWKTLEDNNFKILNNVFDKTNKMKTPHLRETVMLNALRPESAAS